MLNRSECEKVPPDTAEWYARRIQRWQARLARLQGLSRRYTWVRVGVFFGGLALSILAWLTFGSPVAWVVTGAAILAFLGVVALHRRLDGWILRFTLWLEMQRDQLARLNLDWPRLPSSLPPGERSPLDVDLDLSGPRSLHALLDLAISRQGSQRLAGWLAGGLPDPAQIALRQNVVRELKGLDRFRGRLQLSLRIVSKTPLDGSRLLAWLEAAIPRRLAWLLAIGFVLSMFNLVLFLLFILQNLPPYWLASFMVSFVFYNFNAFTLKSYLGAVVELDGELSKFAVLLHTLERYPLRACPHLLAALQPFRDPAHRPSGLVRRVKWVTAGVGLRSNPIIGALLNLFLPWDYLFAYLSARLRPSVAAVLPGWLEAWVQLEALLCLANYAALHPDAAFAEIDLLAAPVFAAEGLRHPLLHDPAAVPNDFTIDSLGELALVTGSNMAGKSTFLKALGANLCLAYAGGPVLANRLRCRPFRLHTCIRITDSIEDGISYFYAEVQRLRSLLAALNDDDERPVLYLIDEIFRGTNNRERLAGSRAYIQALLGAAGAGLIATHDLELARLAEADARVHNYHFRDEIADGRLSFDYLIRPGPSPTTNALKIMALEGLPVPPDYS